MGDTRLSHFLARLLRHEAVQRGLDIYDGGYVDIDEVLEQPEAARNTVEDVELIVRTDRKGRFKIRTYQGKKQIKATQGHSIQGLSRRRRTHIHFAPGEQNVKSGFPPGCDMAIEIDLQRALRDGLKFFRSENGVILSPGNDSGVISPRYFRRAYHLGSREAISLD